MILFKNRLLCLITTDYVRTAFSMTDRAIKMDKRHPLFYWRAGGGY
ncbi:hypothetical protein D1BOALGB6SA_8225 [Olavius sp. associated proteobacterium Delta 1]|nr:hypothetical protein D1BOALGB6SA_8225 [Olavius sp. associated proteobacterium Delta 1]